MATVSNRITLGKADNIVHIGNVPDRQHAKVSVRIGDSVVLETSLDAGAKSFLWDLGLETDKFQEIFINHFSKATSAVSAKMKVEVFFSSGVKNLLRGGEYDVSFLLIENNATNPLISEIIVTPSPNRKSKYIQGKSQVQIAVDAKTQNIVEGYHKAEIKSTKVLVDGKSCKSIDGVFVSDWLCTSGEVSVSIIVEDTRGFSNTSTTSIYVEPYAPPIIVPYSDSKAHIEQGRWNPNTSKYDSSEGTQFKAVFGVFASHITAINNLLSCSYRYKVIGSEDYTEGQTIEQTGFDSSTKIKAELIIADSTVEDENGKKTGPFDVAKEYLIEVTITDALGGKAVKVFRLDVLECTWHIGEGGKRFSVGKYATENEVFDSAWTIHTDKNLSVDGRVEKLGEPLPVNFGGTGAETSADARKNLDINLKNLGVSALANDLNLMSGAKASGVTSDNIKNLYGLTSNVQDQLNDKSDADHTHNGYAPSSHTHTGYASSDHKHDIEDIIAAPSTKCESTLLVTILSSINSDVELVEDECWATVWGKVCEIYISFKYNKALTASENFENIKIGTLTNAYKPTHYVGCHSGGAGFVVSGEITSGGVLNLASVGSDVPADSKMSLTATYLLP